MIMTNIRCTYYISKYVVTKVRILYTQRRVEIYDTNSISPVGTTLFELILKVHYYNVNQRIVTWKVVSISDLGKTVTEYVW